MDARIATKVDQVVDVFYIQDMSGAKIEDEQKISTIKTELLRELERPERTDRGEIRDGRMPALLP